MTISLDLEDRVAIIEVQRPPANYFSSESLGQIADAGDAAISSGARSIVMCSQGKHFSAGADFGDVAMTRSRGAEARAVYAAALRIFAIGVPVIAAVQGKAIGGGLGLACAADFRVLSSASAVQANFVRLGFHQGFGLSVSLPRIVGAQRALDLLLTGRAIGGDEAMRIGLADRLTTPGDERRTAMALAREIALYSAPAAVRSIRATQRGTLLDEVRAAVEREIAEQDRLWQTSDSNEGIAAIRERRAPDFQDK